MRQADDMAATLTLMAVHAHPDDESSSTGGVLAHYAAERIRMAGRDDVNTYMMGFGAVDGCQ